MKAWIGKPRGPMAKPRSNSVAGSGFLIHPISACPMSTCRRAGVTRSGAAEGHRTGVEAADVVEAVGPGIDPGEAARPAWSRAATCATAPTPARVIAQEAGAASRPQPGEVADVDILVPPEPGEAAGNDVVGPAPLDEGPERRRDALHAGPLDGQTAKSSRRTWAAQAEAEIPSVAPGGSAPWPASTRPSTYLRRSESLAVREAARGTESPARSGCRAASLMPALSRK